MLAIAATETPAMIAAIKTQESKIETSANHTAFVAMLLAIRRSVQITFSEDSAGIAR